MLITELPNHVQLFDQQYHIERYDAFTGLTESTTNEMALTFSLTDAVSNVFSKSESCFMILGNRSCAYTSAICKSSASKFIYFHSHSRTMSGISTMNGTAMLLEIASADALVRYIKDLAKSLFVDLDHISFELIPIFGTLLTQSSNESNVITTTIKPEALVSDDKRDNGQQQEVCSQTKGVKVSVHGNEHYHDDNYDDNNDDDDDDDEACFQTFVNLPKFIIWKSNRSWLCFKRLNAGKQLVLFVRPAETSVLYKSVCRHRSVCVADEWITGITARNSKKLHDKMSDHQRSQAHKTCAKELDIRSAKLIEESNKKAGHIWRERNPARIRNTARVVRTVYAVA